MVKAPYLDSNGLKKGAWSEEEDFKLKTFVHNYGYKNWRLVPIYAGINRCGKSCRLRWVNYLSPDLKRGGFTRQEHDLIVELHDKLGSRWSTIASYFPGRTDNAIKNYWHGHIKRSSKRSKKAIDKQIATQHHKPSSSYSSSSSTNDRSNIIESSSENPPTEISPLPQACRDDHIIDGENHYWDPFGGLSDQAFDFGTISQEIETDKSNSYIIHPSSTSQLGTSDATSYLNDEFDGNLWSSGLFWNEDIYIKEPKKAYVSLEDEYNLSSYGCPEYWDSLNLFD